MADICEDCGTELDDGNTCAGEVRHYAPYCIEVLRRQRDEERAAKRDVTNTFVDLVEVGRILAMYQPAILSRTQSEADLWGRFYRLLNEAPVTFGPGLGFLPGVVEVAVGVCDLDLDDPVNDRAVRAFEVESDR